MSEVTRILSAIVEGDPSAPEQLLPVVYDELCQLAVAAQAMRRIVVEIAHRKKRARRRRLAPPAHDRRPARIGPSKKICPGWSARLPSVALSSGGQPPLGEVNVETVEDIFLAVVELAPADRAAYLDGTCGSDAELEARKGNEKK